MAPKNLFQGLSQRLLGGFQLSDILHAGNYSADFDETRAGYINQRLSFMLLFFVLAVPAWIPIDYLTLEQENFILIAWARLGLAALLALLWLLARSKPRPRLVHSLVAMTLVGSAAFYMVAMVALRTGISEIPLAGYSAMPMMMIALMGLFPVTLLCGGLLATLTIASYLALEAWSGHLFDAATLNTLWVLCLITGVTLWIQTGQLLMLLKLYRESTRDALTGLINRRILMKQFELQIAPPSGPAEPFCVLMCDLDRFKRINDNYGHLVGDLVLKKAAQVLTSQMRQQDVVARFGGEEFMAILPKTRLADARRLAEAVRAGFETTQIDTPAGQTIPVTTSIGLTEYQPGERIEVLLERADQLLYRAKQQGRNQVVDQLAAPAGG